MNNSIQEQDELFKENAIKHINKLKSECEENERWLSSGMSNPMKIRWRKRDLKNAQKEISELKLKYNL